MNIKLTVVIAVCAGLLLSTAAAFAQPMRCSGEQKTCIANCQKIPNRAIIPTCVTNCGARQSACMKTSCWDSGTFKYCGLMKQ